MPHRPRDPPPPTMDPVSTPGVTREGLGGGSAHAARSKRQVRREAAAVGPWGSSRASERGRAGRAGATSATGLEPARPFLACCKAAAPCCEGQLRDAGRGRGACTVWPAIVGSRFTLSITPLLRPPTGALPASPARSGPQRHMPVPEAGTLRAQDSYQGRGLTWLTECPGSPTVV